MLALALAVRGIYLLEIRRLDPFYGFAFDGFDQKTYQAQAQDILEGDWLLRRWGLFYYSPLYGYFCGLLFRLGGAGNFDLLHLVQALLGVGSVLLLWSLARTYLSRAEALAAGVIAAGVRAWLFYEQVLLAEGLIVFLHLLTLRLCRRAERLDAPARVALLGAGLAAGWAYLGRGNFLAVAVAFIVWLGVRWWAAAKASPALRGRAAAGLALFGLGLAIVLIPLAARNRVAAGRWRFGTTNGPAMLYLGNAADATGIFAYSPRFEAAHARSGEDPGIYLRRLREDLIQHPGRIAFNLLRKTAYFWNAYDLPDNTNLYLGRAFSVILRWTPATEWTLLSLGLLGAGLSLGRWRQESLLWVYLLIFSASIILIVPVGRYKIPVLIPLVIFAARAIGWLRAALGNLRWKPLATAAAALTLVGALAWPGQPPRRQDYSTFIRACLDQRRYGAVERLFAWGDRDYPGAPELANLRLRLYVETGDWPAARRQAQLLRSQGAYTRQGVAALVELLLWEGQVEEARELLRGALSADPADPRFQELSRRLEAGGSTGADGDGR